MARSKGKVSWHASAISLHAGGASANEVFEALQNLSEPPGLAAVRKFLSRSKADPVHAMQMMAKAPKLAPVAPVLSERENQTLSELFVSLELHRVRVLKKVLMEAEEFLDTGHRDIERTQKEKFYGAVELLKVLIKPTGTAPELAPAEREGTQPMDDRRRAVHARLAELAAIDA